MVAAFTCLGPSVTLGEGAVTPPPHVSTLQPKVTRQRAAFFSYFLNSEGQKWVKFILLVFGSDTSHLLNPLK